MKKRSPILTVLQLLIAGFIFWQFYQMRSLEPGNSPSDAAQTLDDWFRMARLIFFGGIAIVALNILYPVVTWGVGKLRERQQSWEPADRFVVAEADDQDNDSGLDATCPSCGASLFGDDPKCPWCGHQLT